MMRWMMMKDEMDGVCVLVGMQGQLKLVKDVQYF